MHIDETTTLFDLYTWVEKSIPGFYSWASNDPEILDSERKGVEDSLKSNPNFVNLLMVKQTELIIARQGNLSGPERLLLKNIGEKAHAFEQQDDTGTAYK